MYDNIIAHELHSPLHFHRKGINVGLHVHTVLKNIKHYYLDFFGFILNLNLTRNKVHLFQIFSFSNLATHVIDLCP